MDVTSRGTPFHCRWMSTSIPPALGVPLSPPLCWGEPPTQSRHGVQTKDISLDRPREGSGQRWARAWLLPPSSPGVLPFGFFGSGHLTPSPCLAGILV